MSISVELKDVRYCYENVCAINKVSFTIPANKLTVLVGPNGGGKSTIIKLITGLLKPDVGSLIIRKNQTIGYVAQSFSFDDSFPITVNEVVLTGTMDEKMRPFFRYSANQKQKARSAIEMVGLKGFESRGINQLSGGQLKRVIIARALASDADIIILDEPDSNLDLEALDELYHILKSIKEKKTIIIVSHNIDYILGVADKAVYVNNSVQYFEDPKLLKEKLSRGLGL
jgi:zinc transport system ATP-binding protein